MQAASKEHPTRRYIIPPMAHLFRYLGSPSKASIPYWDSMTVPQKTIQIPRRSHAFSCHRRSRSVTDPGWMGSSPRLAMCSPKGRWAPRHGVPKASQRGAIWAAATDGCHIRGRAPVARRGRSTLGREKQRRRACEIPPGCVHAPTASFSRESTCATTASESQSVPGQQLFSIECAGKAIMQYQMEPFSPPISRSSTLCTPRAESPDTVRDVEDTLSSTAHALLRPPCALARRSRPCREADMEALKIYSLCSCALRRRSSPSDHTSPAAFCTFAIPTPCRTSR